MADTRLVPAAEKTYKERRLPRNTSSRHSSTRALCDLRASRLKNRLRLLHRRLEALDSLEPGAEVDALFSRLVESCLRCDEETASEVLADPELQRLRPRLIRLCSTGEYLLERRWARRAASEGDPRRTLSRFPYYENYERLTRMEAHALRGACDRPLRRALFVGSGPLPLTSILLADRYGLSVDNVDSDPEACRLGSLLAAGMGLTGSLEFAEADARDLGSIADYDLVFLAALVGLDESEKERTIQRIGEGMRPGALLAVRTAHRLKTLLYPQVGLESLAGLRPQVVVEPVNDIVNSIIVADKPAEESLPEFTDREEPV